MHSPPQKLQLFAQHVPLEYPASKEHLLEGERESEELMDRILEKL